MGGHGGDGGSVGAQEQVAVTMQFVSGNYKCKNVKVFSIYTRACHPVTTH